MRARAWIKDEGYMAEVVEIDNNDPVQICVNSTGIEEWYYLDEVVLMSCSDKVDINNAYVYDGDIVKSGGHLYRVIHNNTDVGEIYYRDLISGKRVDSLDSIEVVGNIHKDR